MASDSESIARDLLRDNVITEDEYGVWYDMTNNVYGEGFKVCIEWGLGTRRLQQIAACVRAAISRRRIALVTRTRQRSGRTVASGSHTRHVPDITGDMRERKEWSWQVERMQSFGKLDRWSKKREIRVPVKQS